MAALLLRLVEDVLADGTGYGGALPPRHRFLYVAAGDVSIGGRIVAADDGWCDGEAPALRAGAGGATIWRWELVPERAAAAEGGAGWRATEKLAAPLDGALPAAPLLLRGDSVAFPAGGCALRHVHQGPGIRCLIAGAMRIDTHGHSTWYTPGGAWFEAGPEPVFAQAADQPTRFIRCMVLPAALLGKSSIRYVDEADRDRPKDQRYRQFAETPIAL
jgi:hypothetical protein